MSTLELPLLEVNSEHVLPRPRAHRIVHELLQAESLREAAKVLKWWSERLPDISGSGGWSQYMRELAAAFRVGKPRFRVFGHENRKLPGDFFTWSTLPVYTCPGAGECKDWCYSLTAWHTPGGLLRQVQNTILLKFAPWVVVQKWHQIPHNKTVRLYVDGDFNSVADVAFWMALCRQRPDLSVYGYSKSWDELFSYHELSKGDWPKNYVLNLSSGGKIRGATKSMMRNLPVVRGDFITVPVRVKGNVGFSRYDDPNYHKAVREAGLKMGLKVFSCPGKCGECNPHGHVCGGGPIKADGTRMFDKVTVAIGIH